MHLCVCVCFFFCDVDIFKLFLFYVLYNLNFLMTTLKNISRATTCYIQTSLVGSSFNDFQLKASKHQQFLLSPPTPTMFRHLTINWRSQGSKYDPEQIAPHRHDLTIKIAKKIFSYKLDRINCDMIQSDPFLSHIYKKKKKKKKNYYYLSIFLN